MKSIKRHSTLLSCGWTFGILVLEAEPGRISAFDNIRWNSPDLVFLNPHYFRKIKKLNKSTARSRYIKGLFKFRKI
jgi:hypothetical protein